MALLDWFKRNYPGAGPANGYHNGRHHRLDLNLPASHWRDRGHHHRANLGHRHAAALVGLSLQSVIDAHRAWRQQLADALNRTHVERHEIVEAGRSDRCVLGQWIMGVGAQAYGHRAEYPELVRAHTKFHLLASAILIAYHAGNRDEALHILNGDFERLSEQVQLHLLRLSSV